MKIGAVYPVESYVTLEKPLAYFSEIQFGISHIVSVLQADGHEVELILVTQDTDYMKVLTDFIKRYKPDMFCLTSVTSLFPVITRVAEAIKYIDDSIYVVLGGAHATLSPESAILHKCFDSICIGEGEEAVLKLASLIGNGKRPTDINNLWIRNVADEIEKNETKPFIQDLDNLPYVDRDLWKPWIVHEDIHAILLGRGCPFKCAYCSNHSLAKVSDGKYVRFRSIGNVLGEIRNILSKWPDLSTIYFEVETFGANVKYAKNFLKELESLNNSLDKPIKFGVNLAVTRSISRDIELLEFMRRANFTFVNIGLESGNERVRKDILRRPGYSNHDLINFCKMARSHGVAVNLFILMGVPGETAKDFQDTIDCARECKPSSCQTSIFHPYPGTDLYNVADGMGLIKKSKISELAERSTPTLDLPGFSRWRLRYEYVVFPYKVFNGRHSYSQIFGNVLKNFLGAYPSLHHILRSFANQTKVGLFLKKRMTTVPFATGEKRGH